MLTASIKFLLVGMGLYDSLAPSGWRCQYGMRGETVERRLNGPQWRQRKVTPGRWVVSCEEAVTGCHRSIQHSHPTILRVVHHWHCPNAAKNTTQEIAVHLSTYHQFQCAHMIYVWLHARWTLIILSMADHHSFYSPAIDRYPCCE